LKEVVTHDFNSPIGGDFLFGIEAKKITGRWQFVFFGWIYWLFASGPGSRQKAEIRDLQTVP
jgi:hypothetical protein